MMFAGGLRAGGGIVAEIWRLLAVGLLAGLREANRRGK